MERKIDASEKAEYKVVLKTPGKYHSIRSMKHQGKFLNK